MRSLSSLHALVGIQLAFVTGDLAAAQANGPEPYECLYRSPSEVMAEFDARVKRGDLPDPALRTLPVLPEVPVRLPGGSSTLNLQGSTPCLSTADIILYEDTNLVVSTQLLDTSALYALFTEAANRILTIHGDRFDFVAFWANHPTPPVNPATGVFWPILNDVHGIGDAYGSGHATYDSHRRLGLAGAKLQGFLFFTDINKPGWSPGNGPEADRTRLVLGHEFAHRFGLFLPPLLDGRVMQGNGPPFYTCGDKIHWSWRVDGQGSSTGISEWVGSNPANLLGGAGPVSHLLFNADIPGGLYSYMDLYLMGMISATEMDLGNSESRYMDTSNCNVGANYGGSISPLSSADIIAAAGPRVPDWTTSQKDFRTAWVMLHKPGDEPDSAELDKLVGILQQHMVDFNFSTLGRATMNDTLHDHCAQAIPYGCGVNPDNSLTVLGGAPSIGTTLVLGVDNPLGTQSSGSLTVVYLSTAPDSAFPCGTLLSGFGMGGGAGELLIDVSPPNPLRRIAGAAWSGPGVPASVAVRFPSDFALVGSTLYAQGLMIDASAPPGVARGLTNALELRVGP